MSCGGDRVAVGRHRREVGQLYQRKTVLDNRGNRVVVPDDRSVNVEMSYRSTATAKGEAEGQLSNEQVTFFVSTVDVDGWPIGVQGPWTQIRFDGRLWDCSAPPVLKRGRRRTEHWEFPARPAEGGDTRYVRDATQVTDDPNTWERL